MSDLSGNLAGDAFAADLPDMTPETTRATWTEDGLRAFMARIREAYGPEFYARITSVQRVESDARAGDAAVEPGRVVDCRECPGPVMVTGTEVYLRDDGPRYWRLACGHLVRAS